MNLSVWEFVLPSNSNDVSQRNHVRWCLLIVIAWAVLALDSLTSAVTVWSESATYNHCFFVLPIVAYLLRIDRAEIASISPRFDLLFLPVVLACIAIWVFGIAGGISLFEHFGIFAMLPALWLLVLGRGMLKVAWFPMLFVLFSVPVGEELVPLFQEITADVSVQLLVWSGVPTFREGLYIQIPEGKFLVAEACSGIRFFVSTVMLGALYAYLVFTTVWKRALFMLFAICLPIAANALRAYGTMIIGHTVDMKYAAGADHLIYGWFFFALITLILITVAIQLKERPMPVPASIEFWDLRWLKSPGNGPMACILVLFIGAAWWSHSVVSLDAPSVEFAFPDRASPQGVLSQRLNTTHFPDADTKMFWTTHVNFDTGHSNERLEMSVSTFAYTGESPNAELVSWKNRLYEPNQWTLESDGAIKHGNLELSIFNIVSNKSEHRTIAYLYDVDGYAGPNKVKVKLQQTFNTMSGKGKAGVIHVVSVFNDNFDENYSALSVWLSTHAEQLLSVTPW